MAGASTVMVIFIASIFFPAVGTLVGASSGRSMLSPGCPDKCGDVSIPYPFGIGAHCAAISLNSYFNLDCDSTVDPPRPTVGDPEVAAEIADISLKHGEMRVYSPVNHICFTSNTTFTKFTTGYDLKHTPFLPSPSRNRFTVIGCNTLGLITGYKETAGQYVTGCYSNCEGINNTSEGAPCNGMGCCEVSIPTNLTSLEIDLGWSCSVFKEELVSMMGGVVSSMMSGIAAGEFETFPKTATSYPEGIDEAYSAQAGGAVGQCCSGRNTQEPIPSGQH